MLAPNNNRGMAYQTDEKHLNIFLEYFVGVIKLACYALNTRLLLRVLPIISLNIYSVIKKTLKMLHLIVFWTTQACTIPPLDATIGQVPALYCPDPRRPPRSMNSNETHKTLTKHNFLLATTYGTFQSLVVYENFGTRKKPLLSS